jgi:hypothetical protein
LIGRVGDGFCDRVLHRIGLEEVENHIVGIKLSSRKNAENFKGFRYVRRGVFHSLLFICMDNGRIVTIVCEIGEPKGKQAKNFTNLPELHFT